MADDTLQTQDLLKDVFDASRDDDPEVRLQRVGTELVNRMFMLYRTARVHDLDNAATKNSMQAFCRVIEALSDVSDSLSLLAVGEGLYLNKILLKSDFSGFENFRYLSQLFRDQHIAGVTFHGVPPSTELREFLEAMLKSRGDPDDETWIGQATFPSIRIHSTTKLTEAESRQVTPEMLADPHYLLRLYLKTVLTLRWFVRTLQEGEMVSTSRLQRAVHEFVDAMGEDQIPHLALATIRNSEEYLIFHSINVALLSLLVGREIGMNKRQLSDLGMAGLLHDIGKVQISSDILSKQVQLTPEEWKELQKSNTYSLLQLIQLRGFHESALRRMLVAYEHTLDAEGDGSRKPTLYSRIVAITHCYDAMTTPQSYRDALLPNEALKLMNQEVGTKFDAALFQVFLKVMTIYPPGSLVRLTSHEIALVMNSAAARRDPDLPIVRLLYAANGEKLPLTDVDLTDDPPQRRIVSGLDPVKYRINPLLHLLGLSTS